MYNGGITVKKRLKELKKITKMFRSIILVDGKRPIEKNWQTYCREKRPLNIADIKNYNAGLPCGTANRIIVLDIDDRKKMKELKEEKRWEIPETFTVKTGGDRRHYYYSYPDNGNDYGNYGYNDSDSGKHVFDIKGIGGMVVAPGSRHPDTKLFYKIKKDLPIAPAPKWLLDLALKKKPENTSESDIKNELMISNFLSKLKGVKQTSNNSWKALCPVHDDHDPSLSISSGNDGRILIHCFAHCSPEKILNRVGMSWPDLFTKPIDRAITVIEYVRETKEPNAVYDSIRVFADLTAAQLANVTQDLKEILGDKLNLNDFRKAVNESEGYKIRNENNRPIIQANNRPLDQITEESLKVLYDSNDPPSIFVRSGELVRLRADENDRPIIETINDAMLRGSLGSVADFIKCSTRGMKYISPPLDVVKNILSIGTWGFPALEGVVEAPILRADGSVLNQQGYDKATKMFYIPSPKLNVPEIPKEPSKKEIKKALNLIEEVFVDYPFADEISKANTYALLLTPLIRPIFDGLAPMAVIDAPDRGTGKSMLADIVALIATGRTASLMTAQTDEAEWRKKITSLLLEGAKTILIDNVTRSVHSDSLATVLTSHFWEDRILGLNKIVRIKHGSTWIITGNNIKISGDLPRRCYWIRIDAKTTKPWTRTEFKHKNLPEWVAKKRGKILAALLTIVTAWFSAGSPKAKLKALGSYDEWAKIVGGILKFVGISGFLDNIDAFYERTDDESMQWEDFLIGLRKHYQKQFFTAKTLSARLKEDEKLCSYLPDSLCNAFDNPKKSFERVLGKALAQKEDVHHGKRQIRVKRAGMDGHAVRWKVVKKKLENSK